MKVNRAPKSRFVYPDKLYARCEDNKTLDMSYAPQNMEAVEYIRTDAFIEKALKWYCLDCECNDNCKDTKCFFHNEYKRFLEGNKNACPPKFEYTILNPDGSTSDNWRYRHFTRKIQDTFIEKACDFFEENIEEEDCKIGSSEWTELRAEYKSLDSFIRAFVKYMEGE